MNCCNAETECKQERRQRMEEEVKQKRNKEHLQVPYTILYWISGESWHAIKKLLNPPLLVFKTRHPALFVSNKLI